MAYPEVRPYVLIPVEEITTAMINASVHGSLDDIRHNSDSSIYCFEMRPCCASAFGAYTWYSKKEIEIELAKAEWAE